MSEGMGRKEGKIKEGGGKMNEQRRN